MAHGTRSKFLHGIIGGIVAGLIFAVAEMFMNLTLGKPFFGPLKMISSIVLGTQALQPTYSFATAAITGLIVHMLLSMVFGVIFVYLVTAVQRGRGTGELLAYGTAYGVALWIINFFVIGAAFFPQFLQVNQFWNGFVAHAFFFGTVLGWYTAEVQSGMAVEIPAQEERKRMHG